MAILKIKKHENPYLIIDKTCFNDPRLSWKAKGLHGYLMGLPSDWEIRVADLIKRATDQRDSVYNALKELMAAGYLTCRRERNAKGHYQGLAYDVHETPQVGSINQPEASPTSTSGNSVTGHFSSNIPSSPHPDFPDVGSPDQGLPKTVKPDAEKPTLVIKEISNYPNTKNTAAKAEEKASGSMVTEAKPAAAFSSMNLSGEANRIGTQLTETQAALVSGSVRSLCQTKPDFDPEQLEAEITYALLNPKSSTGAGHDFMQKLNTILKTIRQGRWTRPAGFKTQAEQAEEIRQQQCKVLQSHLAEVALEREHWKRLLEIAQETRLECAITNSRERYLQANEQFEHLQAQLKAIHSAEAVYLIGK